MSWVFSSDRPIYSQLVEQLSLRIVTGVFPPGSRFDTVRDLAAEFEVNPNTVQRAMSELERLELVRAERTAGRFVTDDVQRIADLRAQLVREKTTAFLREMSKLGFDRREIITLLEKEDTI